nr:large T antigen [Rhinolophus affinis polyomavirus 4]
MDHTLSREETKRLMELLKLPLDQYGNFPLMRKSFLQRCKVMHPDKGGDPDMAKELISLYRRLEESLPALHTEEGFSTSKVCETDNFKIFGDYITCKKLNVPCSCIFCLLRSSHKFKPPFLPAKPKCWGDCLCYACYLNWFGLEDSFFILQTWINLIGNASFFFQMPPYGTPEWEAWWNEFNSDFDLFCHETYRSDDEDEPSTSSQKRKAEEDSPHGSQATPPKKKKEAPPVDIPEDLKEFLSQAIFSNKTMNCFLIYTTLEKSSFLYRKLAEKYNPTFISRHKKEDGFIFLITPTKHRVSAISNYCTSMCSISFLIVKGVIKEFYLYTCLSCTPYSLIEESIPGGLSSEFFDNPEEANKNVSWKMIAEYALEIMCDDLHLLIGLYKEFAEPHETCKKCDDKLIPDHFKYHRSHRENAQHFLECRNQKSICQQAVDGVIAKRRVDCAQLTRKQQLASRFLKLFDKMETLFGCRSSTSLEIFMAGVCWFDCMFPNMKDLVLDYIECVTLNIPKKRYWLFTGPVNTGKTTLAAALLDLCGGKSLNVNMPFEKISFELGVAIDQFSVVFEDVKGQLSENKKLPTGQGINNLDNLRDYLDGAVKVNLEKKHLNKKTQIFPPGIVTANEYTFPVTLRVRFCKTLRFVFHKHLWLSLRKTELLSKHRVLQNGITLLLLLVYYCEVTDFLPEVQEKVTYWKQRIDEEVTDKKMFDMLIQCKAGKCILSDPDQEDSGIFSEEQTTQTESQ